MDLMKKVLGGVLGTFILAGSCFGAGKDLEAGKPEKYSYPDYSQPKKALYSVNLALQKKDISSLIEGLEFEDAKNPEQLKGILSELKTNKEMQAIIFENVKLEPEFSSDAQSFDSYAQNIYTEELTPKLLRIYDSTKKRAGYLVKEGNKWKYAKRSDGKKMLLEETKWAFKVISKTLEDYKKQNGFYPEFLDAIEQLEFPRLFGTQQIEDISVDYFHGNMRMYSQYLRGDNSCLEGKGSKQDYLLYSYGPNGQNEEGKKKYNPKTGKGDVILSSSEKFFESFRKSKCFKPFKN